jgi:serine/threonine protein kinase
VPRDEGTAGLRADRTTTPVGGRYELHELIGRGGMGSVWRGEDLLLQRPVAVKRVELPLHLPDRERDALRQRVLREARAAARVSHPRLVTIFDVVEEDGIVFLVQELVDAPTLKAIVTEQGPLAPSKVAAIGKQLVDGLAAAHRAGVVHRDVKPSNVMVLPDGSMKLADFGIASLHGDPQITATGVVVGSPAYMAPEQATGDKAGPAADLWSVGATLYFAVEGEPPFGRADTLSTLTAVVNEPYRDMVVALLENYRLWCPRVDFCSREPGFTKTRSTTLFDTVAVYLALAQDLVRVESMGVRVADDGMTVPDASAPPQRWATSWKDRDGFSDLLTERLLAAPRY